LRIKSKMTIKQKKKFLIEILKAITKLVIAGGIIGIFHKYDFWIAVFLAINIGWRFYTYVFKPKVKNLILFYGMFITGIAGILAEYWGVSNNHWSYHDLGNGRMLPYWLVFAWMLAFYFLYNLEIRLVNVLKYKTIQSKIYLMLFVAIIFPAFGEIITINLGVWTYHWPMQLFGVPLYAVLCLVILHMFINFIMAVVCKKYLIQDPIFSVKS